MGPGLLNQDSMCLGRVPEWGNWCGPWHESEGHRQAGARLQIPLVRAQDYQLNCLDVHLRS